MLARFVGAQVVFTNDTDNCEAECSFDSDCPGEPICNYGTCRCPPGQDFDAENPFDCDEISCATVNGPTCGVDEFCSTEDDAVCLTGECGVDSDCGSFEVCVGASNHPNASVPYNGTCVIDCAGATSCGSCISRGCTFCENAGLWQGCVPTDEAAATCGAAEATVFTTAPSCPAFAPSCSVLANDCTSCLDNTYGLDCAICGGYASSVPAGGWLTSASCVANNLTFAAAFECPGYGSDPYVDLVTDCVTECDDDDDCWFGGGNAMSCVGGPCQCDGFARLTDPSCVSGGE